MAITNSNDSSHIVRTSAQWKSSYDSYDTIPLGVLCVELIPDGSMKIKIGDGHNTFAKLPYVGGQAVSEYYSKRETDERIKAILKEESPMRIKGVLSGEAALPSNPAVGDVYFVLSRSSSSYIEYVYATNHSWIPIGGTPVDSDLSGYATQDYVNKQIDEVNTRIDEIVKGGTSSHTHDNKDILDSTTASFTKEDKAKLDSVSSFTSADRDKLNVLIKNSTSFEKIAVLEKLAHEHSNKRILDRTTASFTIDYEQKMKWLRPYMGAENGYEGIMGLVPPAQPGEEDYVLNGAGEWVPMEGGSGSVELTPATTSKLGGIIVGKGLKVDKFGILSTEENENNCDCDNVGHFDRTSGAPKTGEIFNSYSGRSMNKATGDYSHAEGVNTHATGEASHSEGSHGTASGNYSHAEGMSSVASGDYSHAQGNYTIANGSSQFTLGKFNIPDNDEKYAVIIGGGTADNNRKNIFTVDWSGNIELGISDINGNITYGTINGVDITNITVNGVTNINESEEDNTITVVFSDGTSKDIAIKYNGGSYETPIATTETAGIVKPGNGLGVLEDGTLNVKYGDGLTLDDEGKLKVDFPDPYELPAATETTLGGIIVGNGLNIDENGVLTASIPTSVTEYAPGEGISFDSNVEVFKVNPNMTSDTAPYGQVIYPMQRSGREGFRAFDGTDSQTWSSSVWSTPGTSGKLSGNPNDVYIGYMFDKEYLLTKFTISFFSNLQTIHGIIQVHKNDSWITVVDDIDIPKTPNYNKFIRDISPIICDGFRYCAISSSNGYFAYNDSYGANVCEFEAYGTDRIEQGSIIINNTGVLDVKSSEEKNQIIVTTKDGDKPINIDIESIQGVLDVKTSSNPNQIIVTTSDGDKTVDIDVSVPSTEVSGYNEGEAINIEASTIELEELEYIFSECHTTNEIRHYIDSGIIAKDGMIVYVTFAYMNPWPTDSWITGIVDTRDGSFKGYHMGSSTGVAFDAANVSYDYPNIIDGRVIQATASIQNIESLNVTIPFFGRWLNFSIENSPNARLYYAKIVYNNETVGEYIPVKRTSDGMVGLYDKISNKFLYDTLTPEKMSGGPIIGRKIEIINDAKINVKYDPNTLAVNKNNELTVIGGNGYCNKSTLLWTGSDTTIAHGEKLYILSNKAIGYSIIKILYETDEIAGCIELNGDAFNLIQPITIGMPTSLMHFYIKISLDGDILINSDEEVITITKIYGLIL